MASFAVPAVLRTFTSTARGCCAAIVEIRVIVAMTPAAHKALVLDVVKR
jgi:hypothetical protein